MSTSTSVFPFAHIALTAAITAGAALLGLVALRARFKTLPLVDCLLVAVVAGISVLVWRSAGKTGALNTRPLSPVRPHPMLLPPATCLFIRLFPGFARPAHSPRLA